MLVYLGLAMKHYLIVVGRRTLNGHSIVDRGRLRASIPILLCTLMLLLSACGREPDLRDSETLSRILAEAVDEDVLQERGEENAIYAPNESEPYTGWVKRMYRNGTQVEHLAYFESGELTRWVKWDKDGQMRYERHIENGELRRQVEWHVNGQKASEGHYENGERTGQWVEWHVNGQKASEGHYENGERTGQWVEWREDGQKASEGHYENGRLLVLEKQAVLIGGQMDASAIAEFLRDLDRYPEYSLIVDDTRVEGSFFPDYALRYGLRFQVLTASGQRVAGRDTIVYEERRTDWMEVSKEIFYRYDNYVGMVVTSKSLDGRRTGTNQAHPPGYQYVGNPQYGFWGSGGFWQFYGQYALMRDLMGGWSVGRGDWEDYRRNRERGRPYYGPVKGGRPTFGSRGSQTQKTRP